MVALAGVAVLGVSACGSSSDVTASPTTAGSSTTLEGTTWVLAKKTELGAELARGGVAQDEGVQDPEPGRVGDGGQRSRASSDVAQRGTSRRLSVH